MSLLQSLYAPILLAASDSPGFAKESIVIAQSSDTTLMQTMGAVGLILCTAGFFYRMTISVSETALSGKVPDLYMVSVDLALNILFITYVGRIIASGIWDIGHLLGDEISGQVTVSEMWDKLKALNLNNIDKLNKSSSIISSISNFLDVLKGGLASAGLFLVSYILCEFTYMIADMSKSFFDNLQVVIFNITYVFSPVLVGLGSFGQTLEIGGKMKAIKLWIDVSAWSITMGIVMLTFKGMIFGRIAELDTAGPQNLPVSMVSNYEPSTHAKIPETMDMVSLTIFILGCTLATPTITSTILGGASAALGGAGRTFTGLVASAAEKGLRFLKP